jgi:hypothetical protein
VHKSPPSERLIRKYERAKHLDELIVERDGLTLEAVTVLRESEGGIKQQLSSAKWQFLRRRSPCVESLVVPSATVKILKSSLYETQSVLLLTCPNSADSS